MLNRSIFTALFALFVLALPSAATAAAPSGAVIFSRAIAGEADDTGGLYAAREGRLNQLTENPADSQPAFSPDGRTIAFVRDGDLYSMRADGSGQRALTGGPEVDQHPSFSPNGRYLLFERRGAAEGTPRDLYTIGAGGGRLHALTASPEDDHDASFSPDGRAIVFVRSVAMTGGGTSDDLYSVRPTGAALARLTHTAQDEFAPRYFAGGIVYSRGRSGDGPSAFADIFTMRRSGVKVRASVAGAGSAYVEDVSPDGHLVVFRRDQGLWVKRLGPTRARKLTEVPDGSKTNAVFSSDGRRVATFIATDTEEILSAIDVATGRRTDLAEGFGLESGSVATTIGPVIAWQPVR